MITKAEKMYKRMQKAHKLLSEIEMDLDMDLVNWCVDQIDDEDENVDKMVNAILDFPDCLRDYAMRMRSWQHYQFLYTSNNEYILNSPHSYLRLSSYLCIAYPDHMGSQYRLSLSGHPS